MSSGEGEVSGLRRYELSAWGGRRGAVTKFDYKQAALAGVNCQPGEGLRSRRGAVTEATKNRKP